MFRAFSLISVIALGTFTQSGLAQSTSAKIVTPEYSNIGVVESRAYSGGNVRGSCVLIDDDHVLTCAHVISDPRVVVTLGGEVHMTTLVVVDHFRDWAIFKLGEPSKYKPAGVAAEGPKDGDTLWAYGFGNNRFGCHRLVLSGGDLHGWLDMGDSGGPVLNASGKVVSVNSSRWEGTDIVYAHGLGELRAFVDKWVDSGKRNQVEVPE